MILFLAIKDWANMGCMLSRCLRKVGVDSEAVTIEPTDFQYDEMPIVAPNIDAMKPYLDKAEVIVFMHSHPNLLTIPYDFSKKKLAIFHGGTQYRMGYEEINALYNDKVYVSLVQTSNLLGLGTKNEKWVLPPINTDLIHPVKTANKKPIIGHFPRSAVVKGTEEINRVVDSIKGLYDFHYFLSYHRVGWQENLRRIGRCDISICAMKPVLSGRPYGGGIEITDLESAALGKITVTHFSYFYDRYLEEYGNCMLHVANDPQRLRKVLMNLLQLSDKGREDIKERTREWVVKNHSYEAVGKKLREALAV